jgi:hypothetical protein
VRLTQEVRVCGGEEEYILAVNRLYSHMRFEEHAASVFRAEDGGSMFFRNVDIYLQVHTTLLPRRPHTSTDTVNSEPSCISHLKLESEGGICTPEEH